MILYIKYGENGIIERVGIENEHNDAVQFEADADILINPEKYIIQEGVLKLLPEPEINQDAEN